MSNTNLYNQTHLINEKSYLECNNNYNEKISNYFITKVHNNDKLEEITLSQPNIYTRNGYGWSGNKGDLIDIDSSLRIKGSATVPMSGAPAQIQSSIKSNSPFVRNGPPRGIISPY